ncbi:hypothetical protein AJ80_04915 [Polytolypa hystricis UAMH7299]|uniref:C2H2-type domain-containing protein n=1 Tax=Polytolypa hystricis (strain UAMH7299) TaxID=1447883 RepID=A0A2B7Y8B1_POLH7|nr:hypothetical protein AJ80_04915 [Polytolypa hystricis UAMH7299]
MDPFNYVEAYPKDMQRLLVGTTHYHVNIDQNICTLCHDRRPFESFHALQIHLEKIHLYCEPCQWFAPSDVGLQQHNLSLHFMCYICSQYYANHHDLTGHVQSHRPRTVKCLCCDETFYSRSAMFNHLEAGSCPSGFRPEYIQQLARDFLRILPHSQSNQYLYFCYQCSRPFGRLCDRLQHAEAKCPSGYANGVRPAQYLVNFIESRISTYKAYMAKQGAFAVQKPAANENEVTGQEASNSSANIPSIVVTIVD